MRTKRKNNNKGKKSNNRKKNLGGRLTFAQIKENDRRVREIQKIKETFAASKEKVVIKTMDENSLLKIVQLDGLFSETDITSKDLEQNIDKIKAAIPIALSGSTPKKEWIECLETCQGAISELIAQEINSTSYMLRMLSESIISVDPNKNYTFYFFVLPLNVGLLSGVWQNDKDLLQLIFYEEYDNENKRVKDSRLIMGFGPSASGKTYCAKKIIELLSTQDPFFPKTFLSIDGGIQRECSVVYQLAKTIAIQKGHAGLKNLVSSQNSRSLFDSAIIKRNVKEYLNEQKALDAPDKPRKISLYVPETLGICGDLNCRGKYESYIKITGDTTNWIALVIWQHRTANECNFDDFHKCKGCTESGTTREISEGKKYSSSAYSFSMYNGDLESKQAPGGYFKIHNSGGQVVKVEEELTYEKLETQANSSSFTWPDLNREKNKKTPLLDENGKQILCITTVQDYSPPGKNLNLNEQLKLKLRDFGWEYIKMTIDKTVEKPVESLAPLYKEAENKEVKRPLAKRYSEEELNSLKNPMKNLSNTKQPISSWVKSFIQRIPRIPLTRTQGGKRYTKRRTQRKQK